MAPKEAMNNVAERSSRGVVPEDERAQPNAASEPLQKMPLAEEAPRVAHTETLNLLSNFTGKRLKDHNEEPSSTDRQNVLPNPWKRTGKDQQQQRHHQQQQQQLPQQQRRRSDTDMPIENPANLQSAGSPHNGSYVQILQREILRISGDSEKMRHETERFQSSIVVLQSQIEQHRREIEALQHENDALRREIEALRRDSSGLQ